MGFLTKKKRSAFVSTRPTEVFPVVYDGIEIGFTRRHRRTVDEPRARPRARLLGFIRYSCDNCGWALKNWHLFCDNPYSMTDYYDVSPSEVRRRIVFHADHCPKRVG